MRLISIARLYSIAVVDSLLFGKYTSGDITFTFAGYSSLDLVIFTLRTLALVEFCQRVTMKVFNVSFTKNKQQWFK